MYFDCCFWNLRFCIPSTAESTKINKGNDENKLVVLDFIKVIKHGREYNYLIQKGTF